MVWRLKAVDIVAADAGDGSVRTLFTETADTFVKIQHSVQFSPSLAYFLDTHSSPGRPAPIPAD